jgi:hypothetical protein
MERIAERYYHRHWPLFPDTTGRVHDFLEPVHHVVELYNDHLDLLRYSFPPKQRKLLPPPIDLEQIAPQAEPAIEYLAELAVDLAKFQTSEMMGEQALGYLERHV